MMARTQSQAPAATPRSRRHPALRTLVAALCAAMLCGSPVRAAAPTDSLRTTRHVQLFGAGRTRVLDTYLSPREYAGPSVGVLHVSERTARWGRGRVTVMGLYGLEAAYLHRTTGGGHEEWDGTLTAAFGWHRNWHPLPDLRLALGGLAELTAGGTWLTRGGNNPAQGRAAVDAALSGVADYGFRLWGRTWTARLQLDLPLFGAMFSPDYGQSYYEIFNLGHYSRNVRPTYPGNAPSARLLATLHIPLGRAVVALGYFGEARQSHVNHLKHHAWDHRFMIGYVRRIRLCR